MTVNVDESFVIRGELFAEEDVTINGCVEGKIVLAAHDLRIASVGRASGFIEAKSVVVAGTVVGMVNAIESVEILASATVEATIKCPRVMIADGAKFKGRIDTEAASSTTDLLWYKADAAKMSRGQLRRGLFSRS